MTVDARLLDKLEKKLGVGRRQVYHRISERARALMLPPEQAAIALALEHSISVRGVATPDDLADIRNAARATAPAGEGEVRQGGEAPRRAPRNAARKKTTTRKPTQRKTGASQRKPKAPPPGKTVFVVHGRDTELRRSMFAFLRALGLEPIEFTKAVNKAVSAGGGGSPYVGDIVHKGLRDADGVVVLLSPDDVARLQKRFLRPNDPEHESRLTGQARANVLFEAGIALGVKPEKTILVQVGHVRPFSDVAGMHIVHLHDGAESRQELASRLEAANLAVNTDGTDWYGAGSFVPG